MDFGFGSLVDKFDERLGRPVTTAILWLTAIAVFVVCLKTIVSEGIVPIIEFARSAAPGQLVDLIFRVVLGISFAGICSLVFSAVFQVLTRRIIARADTQIEKATDLLKQIEDARDEATAALEEARAMIEAEKRTK